MCGASSTLISIYAIIEVFFSGFAIRKVITMAECCVQLIEKVHNLTATVETLSSTMEKLVAANMESDGIASLSDRPAIVVSVYMLSFLT